MTAWSGRVDPDGNLYTFLHTGGALNDGHYSNPEVDKRWTQARAVPDEAQRRALYAQVFAHVSQGPADRCICGICKSIVGMSAKVSGFQPVPDGMIRLQGVSLAK